MGFFGSVLAFFGLSKRYFDVNLWVKEYWVSIFSVLLGLFFSIPELEARGLIHPYIGLVLKVIYVLAIPALLLSSRVIKKASHLTSGKDFGEKQAKQLIRMNKLLARALILLGYFVLISLFLNLLSILVLLFDITELSVPQLTLIETLYLIPYLILVVFLVSSAYAIFAEFCRIKNSGTRPKA